MNYQKTLKFIKSFVLILGMTAAVLLMKSIVPEVIHAQSSIQDPLQSLQETTQLPTFETQQHERASTRPGASILTSAILFALDFIKFLLGGVAIVVIIITGIKLIMARKKIDEVWPKQKEHLIMIAIGLIFIFVADAAIGVFFGEAGEVYTSEEQARLAAQRGTEEIRGVYNAAMLIAGSLAILMLVVAGFRLLVAAGNEEVQTKVKKQITWLVLGLFLIGVAEFVVLDVIFPEQGSEIPEAELGISLLVDFTNFVSGFVAFGAIISIIYGGYLYVTAVGNEDRTGKAKKVIVGSLLAIVLALGAFALVNTLVPLQIDA